MSKTASLWAESFWSKSTPVLLAFVIFAAGCGALAQDPVTIVPTWDSTITSDPNAATIEASIQATITRVEADITAPNPDTVNITFAEMGSGLGESSTVQYTVPYSSYVSALQANATPSANDTAAIASLNYNPTITTNNPVNGNADVNVNTALARGLGIANYGSSDGTISLNTSIMNLSSIKRNGIYRNLALR